jgi:hypothetical protein
VQRSRNEEIRAAMVELTLNPIVLFLLVKPSLWERRTPEGTAAALKEGNHLQSVGALGTLNS